MEAQESHLARSTIFVMLLLCACKGDYVTEAEQVYQKLNPKVVGEVKAEASRVLKCSFPPKPNINKHEARTFKELRKDRSQVILTVDNGVEMVVMYKQDFMNKAKELLGQGKTYRTLSVDQNTKQKNKLINILKTIKAEEGLGDITYKRPYPTGGEPPSSLCYQKFTKKTPNYACDSQQECCYIWGGQGTG